jgi:hypothetical protein
MMSEEQSERFDKLAELMEQDKKDEANREDLDFLEECKNDRSEYDQKKYDSGMRDSDFG